MINYLKKMSYILGEEIKKLPFLLVTFVISAFADIIGVSIIGPFSSIITHPDNLSNIPLVNSFFTYFNIENLNTKIIILSLLVILVITIQLVIILGSQLILFKVAGDIRKTVVKKFFDDYIHVPYEFILSESSASLINLFQESEGAIKINIVSILKITSSLILCFSLFIVLANTSLLLLIAIGITIGIVSLVILKFNSAVKRAGKIRVKEREKTLTTFNHSMGGFKETRIIGCENYFQEELDKQMNKYVASEVFFMSYQQVPNNVLKNAIVIALIIFITLSALFFPTEMQNLTSILGIFAVASIRLVPTISLILQSVTLIKNYSFAIDKFYLKLKEIEAINSKNLTNNANAQKTVQFNPNFQNINLVDVTYSYPGGDKIALANVSFSIKKGEVVGIIGKSGAGKTTLVDIILGLLKIDSGDIQIDSKSVYSNLRAWQNLLGYIPQTIFLTDNTIEKNIAFGVPSDLIDSEKIDRVIKLSQLDELIQELPEGVKTKVGERGIRLSGGQRQRIGIARALYHEREILVLDEATSALDNQTEQLITNSINSLAGNKTLIIIAHRLTTLKDCDTICWFDKGQLVKVGTYQEVIPEYEGQYQITTNF